MLTYVGPFVKRPYMSYLKKICPLPMDYRWRSCWHSQKAVDNLWEEGKKKLLGPRS